MSELSDLTISMLSAKLARIMRANVHGDDDVHDDECLEDEQDCMDKYPIHHGASTNGVVYQAYVDIDGLALLLAKELCGEGSDADR